MVLEHHKPEAKHQILGVTSFVEKDQAKKSAMLKSLSDKKDLLKRLKEKSQNLEA